MRLLPRTSSEQWHIKAMEASSLPVHKLALLLTTQPDRVILFIIMRFTVVALAALLSTACALPLVAETPNDAALSNVVTLRSAEPAALAEADPKKHKHHKDEKKKHPGREAAADPEAEAKKHKHHKDEKKKHPSREAAAEPEAEAKKKHREYDPRATQVRLLAPIVGILR